MSTLEKFLVRQTVPSGEPDSRRMTEEDALRILVSDTGGAACPVHEVGVVAAHLVVSIPPDFHPNHPSNGASPNYRRIASIVADACSLPSTALIECNGACDGTPPLCFWNANATALPLVGPHPNDPQWQEDVLEARRSQDVDFKVHVLEPRLDALKMLADRARAEHGGTLPEVTVEAIAILTATLAGHTRWDVLGGMRRNLRRLTLTTEQADLHMQRDDVFNAVLVRLVEGAR